MPTVTMAQSQERQGAVTFKGKPLTLLGPQLQAGQAAPDFQALGQDLAPVGLADLKGKATLISVVPSLDTPVCDAQTRRFNEDAAKRPNVQVWTISADLPFAQKRWCGAAGIERIRVLSDHRDTSFGLAYGVLIKELRLLSRSVFLIDRVGVLRYVEYVPEVTAHPNYDAALAAARQLTGNA